MLLLVALATHWPGAAQPLQRPDAVLYDLRLQALAPRLADPQVVVIDIDERALAAHGRWPWPRRQLAQLLDLATGAQGARLVGLDLVLAEADHSSGVPAVDQLARGPLGQTPGFVEAWRGLRPQLDDDGLLAEVLRRRARAAGLSPVQ